MGPGFTLVRVRTLHLSIQFENSPPWRCVRARLDKIIKFYRTKICVNLVCVKKNAPHASCIEVKCHLVTAPFTPFMLLSWKIQCASHMMRNDSWLHAILWSLKSNLVQRYVSLHLKYSIILNAWNGAKKGMSVGMLFSNSLALIMLVWEI